MEFKAYPKIHRLGKEETDGILDEPVTIQEKIDGANISIWYNDGEIHIASRNRELKPDESFNGFREYIKEHEKALINWFTRLDFTKDNRLYGEWLVKHTITYPDEAYRKVYLFDVYNDKLDVVFAQSDVKRIAEELGFEYPQIFVEHTLLTEDQIKEYVGKSFIAANGEGVVIKNREFKNKYGDHVYAKVVHEKFKESNAIVFGGNNKHSDAYNEMYIVNKYATLGRVQKIMQKLQNVTEERLDMKHIPQVAGTAYHDMVTEEIWDIIKKTHVIDFQRLQRLSMKKFIQLYKDILNNSLSIADTKETK